MRTSLDIDDLLLERARRTAFEERRSIGDVTSERARRGAGLPTAGVRPLGHFVGTVTIGDDVNEPLPEALASIDEPLA